MRLLNDIRKDLTKEFYEEAKHQFVSMAVRAGYDLEDIGFYGEISDIGISDIDAVLIGDYNKIRNFKARYLAAPKDSEFKYCFVHEPVYVLPKCVDFFSELHPTVNLKFLKGEAIKNKSHLQNHLMYVFAVFSIFMYARLNSEIDVSLRKALLLQKSMHKSIELLGCEDVALNGILKPKSVREEFMEQDESNSLYYLSLTKNALLKCLDTYGVDAKDTAFDEFKLGNYKIIKSDKNRIVHTDIYLTPFIFGLVEDSIMGSSNKGNFSNYFPTMEVVRLMYRTECLSHPFVEMFPYFLRRHFDNLTGVKI